MGWLTGDDPNKQYEQYVLPQINQQRKDYQQYQDMLKQFMGGYNFFAPQTTTQQSTTHTDQRVTPETTKEYMNLDRLSRGILERRLGPGGSLPPRYATQGADEIARSYRGAQTQAANLAASRGLSAQQEVAGITPIATAQAADTNKFLTNLPLLERQMRNEDLGLEAQRQAQFGTGQHTVGTTSMLGSTTSPADIAALLQYLGMLAPYQAPIVQPGSRPGALGGLFGVAGQYAPIPSYNKPKGS